MKTVKLMMFIALCTILVPTGTLEAQVTIGSGIPANSGALLDLKEVNNTSGDLTNSTKGLLLPRVLLEAPAILPPKTASYNEVDIHTGLWVYNLTNNSGYHMRNNPEDILCEGPYVWSGERWVRLLPDCPCQYAITGWSDGIDYIISCTDYNNITQTQALSMCNNANDNKNTYHLMTYEEFEQIWSQPVKDLTPEEYSFIDNAAYFVQKKSDVTSPAGWITPAYQSGSGASKQMEVLGYAQAVKNTPAVTKFFPGGPPIGSIVSNAIVRCVKN